MQPKLMYDDRSKTNGYIGQVGDEWRTKCKDEAHWKCCVHDLISVYTSGYINNNK